MCHFCKHENGAVLHSAGRRVAIIVLGIGLSGIGAVKVAAKSFPLHAGVSCCLKRGETPRLIPRGNHRV